MAYGIGARVAEFKLPSPTNETVTVCGQAQRAKVYTIDAEDIQPTIEQLTRNCISGVIRINAGVGILRGSVISGRECGPLGLFISLVGKTSAISTLPSTRLVLGGRNIAITYGATVCMQDVTLQEGRAPSGGALWVVQSKLRMHRTRIENCEAEDSDGGAILIQQSDAILVQCFFCQQQSSEAGRGAYER